MKEKIAEVVINGLIAETYKNCERDSPYPEDHWWGYKIFIYDGLNDCTEQEAIKIVEYLYDEGFIPDRRVEYEIIRSEDFL
tara:strand:- start:27 stop:269 length:243 start_codon:yes stop_codon:yes gene_type:complete